MLTTLADSELRCLLPLALYDYPSEQDVLVVVCLVVHPLTANYCKITWQLLLDCPQGAASTKATQQAQLVTSHARDQLAILILRLACEELLLC